MAGKYASSTTVSVERSRAEIETVLAKYGADRFGYATEPGQAMIAFHIKDMTGVHLMIRMTLPLPAKREKEFTHRSVYQKMVENPPEMVNKLWEQACRSSWRSLCLVIKAKLEACAVGISTIEREFLADVVTADGRTIGEHMAPQIAQIGSGASLPKLLSA